ncbi:ribosome maturation factor RimM [Aliiglaciecola sp. CAU 1673]|uniref:ribosome maturation factor RimM n=1 Tax=Aliiglaciecola sp. CAU 1673 TaxID=3032595 RepID=UPI0023D98E55|nr:ribosome maturation factor RimM [Aliiglaciecola sp. CAU 1673]MDF2177134.1 ribosome maturation factor RimM [Aliiglaciecola sp. CAU 1673]
MSKASDTLVVGKVGAPYGVKGWVKITSYTDYPAGIFDYKPWLIRQGDSLKELQVDLWREQGKSLIAKLVGVEDRDAADRLKNLEICIIADQLPPLEEGDYYWRDLVGLKVVTEKGYDLGTIRELFETGSNDVLVVKANVNDAFGQKERMLPFLMEQVVKKVDLAAKTMVVDWDPEF